MQYTKINLTENDIEYYSVFEDLKQLNDLTLDLFERETFYIEDLEDLAKLKKNVAELHMLIDKKVSFVYQDVIENGL